MEATVAGAGALAPDKSRLEKETMRRVGMRLIPFLIVCYFIAYVDRVNVGFAALTMNKDIGLSSAAFGLGAALFFVAYVICEVPSNLALERFGARPWIARIMISWGMVGAALRLRHRPGLVLDLPLSPRRRRGRLLPGGHPVSDLLVPEGLPGPDRRHVHGGDPAVELLRLAAVRRASDARRDGGLARLAVASHPGGGARPSCSASRRWWCCPAGRRKRSS